MAWRDNIIEYILSSKEDFWEFNEDSNLININNFVRIKKNKSYDMDGDIEIDFNIYGKWNESWIWLFHISPYVHGQKEILEKMNKVYTKKRKSLKKLWETYGEEWT